MLMEIVDPELQWHVHNNSHSAPLLSEWDGRYSADSLGAVVFDVFSEIFDRPIFFEQSDDDPCWGVQSPKELEKKGEGTDRT